MICEECGHANPNESRFCQKCRAKLYWAKVRLIYEDGRDEAHFLFPRKYTLGRGSGNDLIIADASVSRCHAEINYENKAFYLLDYGSKNGTLVNQEKTTRKVLANYDIIQLGNTLIYFYDEKYKTSGVDARTEELVQTAFFEKARSQAHGERFLHMMLELGLSLVRAESGGLLLFDQWHAVRYQIARRRSGEKLEDVATPLAPHLLEQSLQAGAPRLIYGCGPRGETDSGWRTLVVPLASTRLNTPKPSSQVREGVLGVFYFRQEEPRPRLSRKRAELLRTLAQHTAVTVENELLYTEALENRKLQDELSLAREIQQRLLPNIRVAPSGFQVASFMKPCEAVGGDYYDVIPLGQDALAVAVGDVCGKGIPAALLFSSVLAALRTQLEYTTSPMQVVRRLNDLLIKSTGEAIFLTLFFGIYDKRRDRLTFVNAGHPPPLVIQRGGAVRELKGTTPALGILEDSSRIQRTTRVRPGDVLLLYTDGLIEAQDRSKRIYGRRRLLRLVEEKLSTDPEKVFDPQALIDTVTEDLRQFLDGRPVTDDLTLLALKRT